MTAGIADKNQRDAALDASRSFIVQAPAGSGKTELLVQRYLRLLEVVRKPEEIVAITFTRKAAAEMKRRVLEKAAPELAPRLRIQTIDALCASLTRQMPVLAKFGAPPEIVQDASELYREAAVRALNELSAPVARLLAHLDNDGSGAARLIANMLAKRDQWMRRTGVPPTRAELEAALAAERERLLANARALLPGASAELAAELLTQQDEWRKRSMQAQALSGNEPLQGALAALLAMPPARYSDAQWQALEAILALLNPAVAQLKVVFAERMQCDFTEVAQGALRALGEPDEPTDLMLSLDYRIHHLLVDEFQDTSVSQWELLERLTAGWQPDEGKTLFVVGDPMQSIYRFREAEVALFLHARHAGLGSVRLEPLTLSTNFRSQAGVVDWINTVFRQVLPAQEDESSGAVPYSPSTAKYPALPGDAATWQLFEERADEAQETVRRVKEAQGTCAILVRNRSHLDEIVPALKEAGLRFRAIEIEQLGEKQVVQDLYALTRALLHPADRVAWLAILRAPWCGLALEDLARLAEGKSGRTIWELMNDDLVVCKLSEDGRKRLMRAWEPIGQAMIHRLRGTLRDRVEGCWLALGGPACVEDRTDLEDAGIYLDELERLEEAGAIGDLNVLAEALERLYALPDLEADERLQIMTIHKAKGLEFDTVLVPGLDRTPQQGDRPLFIHKELADRKLLLAPIRESGERKDAAYDYVRALEREAEDTEAGRLLYVACTRAKQRLHLLGCVKVGEDGQARAPNKRSLLAKVWCLASEITVVPSSPRRGGDEVAGVVDRLRRLPVDFALPAPPAPVQWQAPPEGREDAEQIEFSWVGETARHIGTVVHRWLQRIAEDALEGWDTKRLERLRSQFQIGLQQRGVPPVELEKAANLVSTALRNTITDDRGRWLLGPHPEARSEYRLRDATRRYVIDRVLRDEDGVRWIVDFKTSRHEGADIEAFLDRERERHGPQLERYARALGEARLGLYFALLRGWREWAVP